MFVHADRETNPSCCRHHRLPRNFCTSIYNLLLDLYYHWWCRVDCSPNRALSSIRDNFTFNCNASCSDLSLWKRGRTPCSIHPIRIFHSRERFRCKFTELLVCPIFFIIRVICFVICRRPFDRPTCIR